jgi:hypothetical protein
MCRNLLLLIALFLGNALLEAKTSQTVSNLTNQTLVLANPVDYHISGTTPLVNSTVNLKNDDAWLFFDNIRPAVVVSTYASNLKVNGITLVNGSNARITMYKQGTVVIPQSPSFKPLTVYTKDNFTGNSTQFGNGYNSVLGLFDNNIRSFRLKRGYMATFATESDGTGYSRAFVAQDDDIVFDIVPKELYGRTSFIRIFPWKFVSKKGWCTTVSNYDGEAGLTEATWDYSWSADRSSTSNLEYIPIKQHLYWPGWDQINGLEGNTAVLGYNEPEHTEQHDGVAYSAATASANMPQFQNSGLRIGSAAPTDKAWITSFITAADAACYRVDFVAMHAYWGGLTAATWYSTLKSWYDATGRPLWITEWNNGANWTTETNWPSTVDAQFAKQLTDIKGILNVMDTCSFVERYSIFNWVENKRAMVLSGALTPAGEYYKADHPDLAYNPSMQVIPKTPVITTPTWTKTYNSATGEITFSITDNNAEMTDRYVLQESMNGGLYRTIAVMPQRAYDLKSTTYTYVYKPTAEERTASTFRLKYEYLNGSALYTTALTFYGNTADDYTKASFNDGDYYILNDATGLFLTNNGTTTPVFAANNGTSAQLWTLYKDTTNRYKITSKSSGTFLNESAVLSSGSYYATWNSYDLLRKNSSDVTAIQNGDKGGSLFWSVSGTSVIGKGTATQVSFPFRLLSATGSGILANLTYKNTTYRNAVTATYGDTLTLAPTPVSAGGTWLWSTGETSATKTINGITESGNYTVTYTCNGSSSAETYSITVTRKNQLADGYYCIINPVDSTRLTNIGTLIPTFLPKDLVHPESQLWSIALDAVSKRYSVYSQSNGLKFLNEFARFNNSTYSNAWNSYEIYQKTGSDQYAFQNGGSSGVLYWSVTSNVITGKGTATMDGFPLCLQPAKPVLKVYPYINGKNTDSLAVLSGTTVELQPKATLSGGNWKWDNGSLNQNRTVSQTGTYNVMCTLYGDTVYCRFKVEIYQKTTLTDGAFFIKNPQDGSYLTMNGSDIPVFQGKDLNNSDAQTWIITKDATSTRYKISSKVKPAFFLDEFGRYNNGTYYSAWNSYTFYNQTGTNLYAIQNGGSSGTAYWKLTNSIIRGKGFASITGFPFELVDPYGEAKVKGSAAAMRYNNGYLMLGDSMLVEAGTKLVLKQIVANPGGTYQWNTGATTDSLVLNNAQQSGRYSVTYTQGGTTFTEDFVVNVYDKNQLKNGLYYIINPSSNKYLSFVHATLKPTFAFYSTNIEMNQGWYIQKDSTVNRYKITPLKNTGIFIDRNGSFNTVNYVSDSCSYEISHLTGSDYWAIRNGGGAGSSYWLAGTSYLTIPGSESIAFPFTLKEYTGPTTGLSILDKSSVTYGPNPFKDLFTLSLNKDATLDILTLDGRRMLRVNCPAGKNDIATGALHTGSYIGILRSGESRLTIKLMKVE